MPGSASSRPSPPTPTYADWNDPGPGRSSSAGPRMPGTIAMPGHTGWMVILADEPLDVPGQLLQPDRPHEHGVRVPYLWAGLAGLLDGWVLGESFGAKRRAADLPGVVAQRRGGALDHAGQFVRGEPLAQMSHQMLIWYRFG